MNVNTSSLRISQLKGYKGMSRTDLRTAISGINAWIIAEFPWISKVIDEYVVDKMRDLSFEEIRKLKFSLQDTVWIYLPEDVPIPYMLAQLISSDMLLPYPSDKIKDPSNEQKLLYKQELSAILDRAMGRINKTIAQWASSPLIVHMGDERMVYEEIERNGCLDRYSWYIWSQFWINYIWYDQDAEEFMCNIPIRIATPWKSEGTPEIQEINPQTIKDLVTELFGKKWNTPKEKKFSWFKVVTKLHTDHSCEYGPIKKSRYISVHISHKDVVNLDEQSFTTEEILSYLQKFLDVQNYLIAEIGKKIGWDGKERRRALFSDSSVYYESKKWWEALDTEISDKFNKLLLKSKDVIRLEDVGGQEAAKTEIKKLISVITNAELARQYGAEIPSWMIFYWPSGTGKTLLAKALASSIDADIFTIKMTDIANTAYINEGAKNIADLFKYLRSRAEEHPTKRMVIIMDEMDALFKKRLGVNASAEDGKIVNTFLTEMDGFEKLQNVLFIGTTNILDSIDNAVKRSLRFWTHIKVDLPGVEERVAIFQIAIKKATWKATIDLFDELHYQDLASESEWLSGADIQHIINRCINTKFYEAVETQNAERISTDCIVQEIQKVKSQNGNKNKIFQTNTRELIQAIISNDQTGAIYQATFQQLMNKVVAEVAEKLNNGELTVPDLLHILAPEPASRRIGY